MPATSPPRAWAEIDLGAIRHNLNVVKQAAKGEYYMPVVKAGAYGHGALTSWAPRSRRNGRKSC